MSQVRKKILYIITKSSWGGAGRYVYDLATHMPESTQAVVACGGTGALVEHLHARGVRTVHVKAFQRDISFMKEFVSLVELFRLMKVEKPDIVHLNSSKAGGLGALGARLSGVKQIIFTVHGWAFNEKSSFVVNMLRRLFSWLTALLSHTVITVSHYDEARAKWMPFVKHKLTSIHNGIEKPDFFEKGAAREALVVYTKTPPHPDATWIGIAAELHPNKGHVFFIDALKMLSTSLTSPLYVVFMGDGELRVNLEARIHEYTLNTSVVLAGFVPESARHLKAFDIIALPSLKEGLPYALLEAGYAKATVLATHVGGIPEIIENRVSGRLVPPGDANVLAAALSEMLKSNTDIYKNALYDFVTTHFSLEQMVKKTVAIYFKSS